MHIQTVVTLLGFLLIAIYLIAVHITLKEQWEHTIRLNDRLRELTNKLHTHNERLDVVEDMADLLNTTPAPQLVRNERSESRQAKEINNMAEFNHWKQFATRAAQHVTQNWPTPAR